MGAKQLLHVTLDQFHNDEDMIEFLKVWSILLDLNVVIELHDLILILVGIETSLLCSHCIASILVE